MRFYLLIFFCLSVGFYCQGQDVYQQEKHQFISYHQLPTWKVIIANWNTANPAVHLFDTEKYKGHGNFVHKGLGTGLLFAEFKERVRHPETREYLPVFLYDMRNMPVKIKGETYTWAIRLEHYNYTDSKAQMQETFIRLMHLMQKHIRSKGEKGKGIAILAGATAALPNSTMSFAVEQEGYPTMPLYKLLKQIGGHAQDIEVLNPGKTIGYLKRIASRDAEQVKSDFRQILCYETLPYRVPIANGILTMEPQTPFSHINLLAKNRGTVNIAISAKLPASFWSKYEGQLVEIIATKDQKELSIRKVTLQEAEKHWKSQQRLKVSIVAPDKNVQAFSHFKTGAQSVQTVACIGSKASNYALLQRTYPQYVRPGFAIPFYFYFQVIKSCGADKLIARLLSAKDKLSAQEIEQQLKAIRKRIKTAKLEDELYRELEWITAQHFKGKRIRLRSSTNCEDLAQFNGAGLYVSKGYNQGAERSEIRKKILKVYASLWLKRAFEERDFFGINHRQAAMGILINEAFPKEYANGVVLTLPKEKGGCSIHINTQYGETAVTNPEKAIQAEEIYFRDVKSKWYVTNKKSSIQSIFVDNPPLTPLVRQLQKVAAQIHILLTKEQNSNYGVDIEFKIVKKKNNYHLYIKQARLLQINELN